MIQKLIGIHHFIRFVCYSPNKLPRNDYREVLDLALLVNPFVDAGTVTIKKPGAHSKARWMCVCIYSLKMFWYQDQEVRQYTEEYKARQQNFEVFGAHLHPVLVQSSSKF